MQCFLRSSRKPGRYHVVLSAQHIHQDDHHCFSADIPKIEIKKKQTRQDEEDIERLRRKSQGEDESSSLNSDDSSWAASFDFPTPAPPPLAAEEVVGAFQLDKYYPVIVVFLFVAILTAFLFKL